MPRRAQFLVAAVRTRRIPLLALRAPSEGPRHRPGRRRSGPLLLRQECRCRQGSPQSPRCRSELFAPRPGRRRRRLGLGSLVQVELVEAFEQFCDMGDVARVVQESRAPGEACRPSTLSRPSWPSTYSTSPSSIRSVAESANWAGSGRERGGVSDSRSPEELVRGGPARRRWPARRLPELRPLRGRRACPSVAM